jgi:hypothetical protein
MMEFSYGIGSGATSYGIHTGVWETDDGWVGGDGDDSLVLLFICIVCNTKPPTMSKKISEIYFKFFSGGD